MNVVRNYLRAWLGINATDMKLHDTRVILFGVQDMVEDKDVRSLRARAKITIKDKK